MTDSATETGTTDEVRVELDAETGVAVVEYERPPFNFLNVELIGAIADRYAELDVDPRCRAIVLGSVGKHFCAGADFAGGLTADSARALYAQAVRLFEYSVPVVAAVQGRAVGGGLGLALSADFRVATPETRFVCNFATLGIHHGFGLSVTLPAVVGHQRAIELLYTAGEVLGEEAQTIGLSDRLVGGDDLRTEALAFAGKIAASAPLVVRSMRSTMRGHLPDAIRAATANELREQAWLLETEDCREGVAAVSERRPPKFNAR